MNWKVFLTYIVIVFSFQMKGRVLAQEQVDQFTTNYNVLYNINENGETAVKQDIEIINNQKDVIATSYSITTHQISIYDVKTTVKNQEVAADIIKSDSKTTVKIKIKNPAVGKNKINKLQLKYKTFDIANKIGEVWNINIPKTSLLTSTQKYDVTLRIPKSFGPEIYVSPKPVEKLEEDDEVILIFNKESLIDQGITASFGKFQILNFRLGYELKNTSNLTTTKEIALPPNILGTQQVAYKTISPKPDKIKQDVDGNTIAVYTLKGKENLDVNLRGTARIIGRQINPKYGMSTKQIPKNLVKKYTKPSKFWPTTHDQIKEIATVLFNENESAATNAQKAYTFTTNNLTYDFESLKQDFVVRKGAAKALSENSNNACLEFTDVFITLSRAMGIPARQLNGYAVVNEKNGNPKTPLSINLKGGDLLHSWAEFYDAEFGWVPVDPTWGSTSKVDYFTKLDTNHFVFTINGVDPQKPLPAGAYKHDEASKQINIDFAQTVNENDFIPVLSFKTVKTINPLVLFRSEQLVKIENLGFVSVFVKDATKTTEILPQQAKTIVINKGSDIFYKDATQKEYMQENTLITEKVGIKISEIILLILAVPGLYMIFYVLKARLKNQKKPIRRLLLRLRDLGR